MKQLSRALLVLIAIFSITTPAAAITLSLDPLTQVVGVGESVLFDLKISGLGNGASPTLGAFSVDINYDAAIIGFTSVDAGSFLGDPLLFDADFSYDDTTPGLLSLYEVSFLDASDLDALQTDAFTLATITFTSLTAGMSPITLSDGVLSDADGNTLSFDDPMGAAINVRTPTNTPVPEPSTLILVGLGLIGVCSIKKK
jgi:hypothetical protein